MAKADVPKPQKSLIRQLPDGSKRAFPTLLDLTAALAAANEIADINDLKNHPEHYPAIFDTWIKSGQLGCLFAVEMVSKGSNGATWLTMAIDQLGSSDDLHAKLNPILTAPEAPDALSVLLPSLSTPDDIVRLVNDLCKDDAWGWEETGVTDGKLQIGLRWMLPAGGAGSWVLGFAPYAIMPFTRKAPFTALVMRTQYSNRPAIAGKLDYVHLADIPPYTKKTHSELWEKTADAKKKLLPDDKERSIAKAKISFVIPESLRGALTKPKTYTWAEQPK